MDKENTVKVGDKVSFLGSTDSYFKGPEFAGLKTGDIGEVIVKKSSNEFEVQFSTCSGRPRLMTKEMEIMKISYEVNYCEET